MANDDRKPAEQHEKLHYFKLCYRDWSHGTRGLSLTAKMFYLELLLWSWDKQRPLPLEPEKIARDIGVTKRQWAKYWPIVARKFTRGKTGYWQARVKADVAAYRAAHRSRVEGGKKGAARRWNTHQPPVEVADDFAASQAEYAQNPPSDPPRFVTPGGAIAEAIAHGLVVTPSIDTDAAYRAFTKPIVNGRSIRRHGQHAWCSPRDGLCVPQFLHEEFLGKSNKPHADLLAWYASTIAALNGHAVGEDALVFWRNSFGHWIGVVTAAPDNNSRQARNNAGARELLEEIHSGKRKSITQVVRELAARPAIAAKPS